MDLAHTCVDDLYSVPMALQHSPCRLACPADGLPELVPWYNELDVYVMRKRCRLQYTIPPSPRLWKRLH